MAVSGLTATYRVSRGQSWRDPEHESEVVKARMLLLKQVNKIKVECECDQVDDRLRSDQGPAIILCKQVATN